MKVSRLGCVLVWVAISFLSLTSCSDDDQDEPEEPVYHQSYVQGQVNGEEVFMNDLNANIMIDKSMYDFTTNSQGDMPTEFDWQVKLLDSQDSIVTLYLHIDNLRKNHELIYSPNDNKDGIVSSSTCYVEVKHLKDGKTDMYHLTGKSPVQVEWKSFKASTGTKVERQDNVVLTYRTVEWLGIEGSLDGMLFRDNHEGSPLTLKLQFRLY